LLVIGTFEHSIELEQALAVLENGSITRKCIMVVPMDTHFVSSMQYIGKSRDRYYKGIEVGMACATASSVVGMSVGYALAWGPIIWALITAFAAFFLGLGLFLFLNRNNGKHLPKKLPEVTVIVQCPEEQCTRVAETMWKYRALSVGQTLEPL